MVLPETSKFTEMPYSSYALGWVVSPYRGHPMLHHSGGSHGFSTLTTFLPNDNIGLVVLANLGGAPVPGILIHNVIYRFPGLDEVPWRERVMKNHNQM